MEINDEDAVLVRYVHGNRGQHRVYGMATGNFYGYHGRGAKFLVHKQDIAAQPQLFVPIEQPAEAPREKKEEILPPEPINKQSEPSTEEVDDTTAEVGDEPEKVKMEELTDIPGISDRISSQLNALGINDFVSLSEAEVVDLMNIKGIGEKTAIKMIMEAARAVGKN